MTNKEIIATLDKLAESIEALRAEVQNNSKTTTSKKSSKSSKKSSTVASTPSAQEVSKKDEGHFIIKGLDIYLIYKDFDEDGSYQFNRKSKGIKHSIREHGAKWSGDHEEQIWKWTFQSKKQLDSFLKDQKEQNWKKRG